MENTTQCGMDADAPCCGMVDDMGSLLHFYHEAAGVALNAV